MGGFPSLKPEVLVLVGKSTTIPDMGSVALRIIDRAINFQAKSPGFVSFLKGCLGQSQFCSLPCPNKIGQVAASLLSLKRVSRNAPACQHALGTASKR